MQLIDNIPVWGEPQEGALRQIKNCARDAIGCALMADHHIGYAVPIGGVVVYSDRISPSGVGFDIGCGNKAVRLDIPALEVRRRIRLIMDEIFRSLSFGVGIKNKSVLEHELYEDPAWSIKPAAGLFDLARSQLGTIGGGNHYVDVFVDEQERVWVGAHFGSRGLGHRIASHFMRKAGAKEGMFVDPVTLDVHSAIGEDYLECMRLAGRYASAGRDWVCKKAAKIVGGAIVEEIHNHHNFAWKERHRGRDCWVVRKGATPAFPGQKGFVGGSMGDISAIVEGVDSDESRIAFYSTVHGAGRVLSRSQAAGTRSRPGRPGRGGEVTAKMMREWIEREGVELRGAGTDESPHCYKRLPAVLEEHKGTIRILHTLRPLGVAMASDQDDNDPYKD